GEWKTIYLDAEGNPVEPAPGTTSQHDCTACVHHCGSALLTALTTLPAANWVLPAPLRAAHAVLAQAADGESHSRAPPARSRSHARSDLPATSSAACRLRTRAL